MGGTWVNLVSRQQLISKTVLSLEECGGVEPPHPFTADFGGATPRVQPEPGVTEGPDGNMGVTEPIDFPFTVSETDPEIFRLTVAPGPQCDCRWTASLSFAQCGTSYTALIDDDGIPFHGVPADQLPTYSLVNGYLEGGP